MLVLELGDRVQVRVTVMVMVREIKLPPGYSVQFKTYFNNN